MIQLSSDAVGWAVWIGFVEERLEVKFYYCHFYFNASIFRHQ